MRTLLNPFRSSSAAYIAEREIAPGVSIRLSKPPRSLSIGGSRPVAGLTDRVHAAWDVLWGKAHAMSPRIQQRLRRAA